MNTAIIVAAGGGTRFGQDTPKQFVKIAGRPLIVHTLGVFERCEAVDAIVLVLSAAGAAYYEEHIGGFHPKLREIVIGGATRAESVLNGLQAVADEDGVVAVHDGARPLVTDDEISRTIHAAAVSGAACLTAEVTDTIKIVAAGVITRTVDRSNLRRALTPQAFRVDVLRQAFLGADLGEEITDECCLVEKIGVTISDVAGSPRNIKVTRPEDVNIVEALLRDR